MRERWPEIKTLFYEVFELDPEARAAALARPEVDPLVRAQVERLLAADATSAGILDQPSVAAFPGGPAPFVGRTVGPWRITREIGRGGMGTVYEATRQAADFAQRVAIKTLRIGLDVPDMVEQFAKERRILAGLQHPGIAALLDGGVTGDGVPYLVLEYVDGLPIDRYCDQNRLGLRDRLDLFRQVLDAVQYAHRQLVIHRDLKPGNILVTSDGHVKLLDFGVARLIHPDGREITQPGLGAITPAYASPEQLRGERASTATDVYSLALVLYRLLTGRTPAPDDAVSPFEVLEALTTNALPPPSTDPAPEAAAVMGLGSVARLRRMLHGELDAVILKALRLEPERRYPSVEALAEDLLRYLRGLPVTARPDTVWYRLDRFVRRRRGFAAGIALAVSAVLGGAALALWQAGRAASEANRATRIASFLQQVIGASAPLGSFRAPLLGPMATVGELLDSTATRIDPTVGDDPEVAAVLHYFFGQAYLSQERSGPAAREFRRMGQLTASSGSALGSAIAAAALAGGRMEHGDWAGADSLLARAEASLGRLDPRTPDGFGALLIRFGYLPKPWSHGLAGLVAEAGAARAVIRANRGDVAGAVTDLRAVLGRAGESGAPADRLARVAALLGGYLLSSSGDRAEGAGMLRTAQHLADSLDDPDVLAHAEVLQALVMTGTATGAEADSLGREVLRLYERATGPASLATAQQLWLRGSTARVRGDTAGQREALTRAMAIVANHPSPPAELRQTVTMEYARTHWLAGRLDSAVTLAAAVDDERSTGGGFPWAESGQLLGALLRIRGERYPVGRAADYARAESVLLRSDSVVRGLLPPAHYWPVTTAGTLVRLYRSWGRASAARRWLAMLPDSVRAAFDAAK